MTEAPSSSDAVAEFPFRVADRYEVRELLGRGGMASVFKAWDEATDSAVALKLLRRERDKNQAARAAELFEREFHTLVHLSHPRVVRAHDYGFQGDQPYYAMELLDGGDLRELAPLPWQDVCTVAYEICSALSLLHSRRLVHRDLTPRNIRKTQSGQAKLMDFGLLSPMGPTTLLAGTPPFVAPELIRTMSLDGRSDLFSLGATLYYALTKRHPYLARSLDQLQDAWRSSPVRPSNVVPGVPPALDDLLLGMLRIDVGSRPKSAAEVMERLVPLLAAAPDDELRAARAYLVTPKLVGRDQVVAQFRKQMMRAVRGRGGGFAVVGAEGTGRSRMLDAFVLEAKLVGATAVRAGYGDATRPFGVAASLAQQIHRTAPSLALAAAMANPERCSMLYAEPDGKAEGAARNLVDVTRSDLDRAELQSALRTWVLEFSSRRPLAIAVDDLDRIDEPSAAFFASLTWEASKRRLVYAAALTPCESSSSDGAIEVVRKHADEIVLAPLDVQEVTALFASSFGNVPNLNGLSVRLMALSGGRPRECMTFAQYLVDEGAITYAGGSWTLPAEIPDQLLPTSLEEVFVRRVAQLTPLARHIAAMLAENLLDRLSRADLLSVELATTGSVDAALDELAAALLVAGTPSGYALSGGAIARMSSASLDEAERRRIHDELSVLHDRAGRHVLLVVYHGLGGSRPAAALDRLHADARTSESRTLLSYGAQQFLGTTRSARAFEVATNWTERLGRPRREMQSMWVLLAGSSAQGAAPAHFYRVAPAWLRQLKHDSGYDDWLLLDSALDPAARAMTAIAAAARRYQETAETERVLSPVEAIQQLVAYVVFAIALSSRALDLELKASLPELLVPFAPVNPMVAAMLTNARASFLFGQSKREAAHCAYVEVLEQLERTSGVEVRYVDKVRAAVQYALGAIDASLGVPSIWLDRVAADQDSNQRVSALFLQKVSALQQGDWEQADAYRQRGELLSLQTNVSSMFSTLGEELEVHAMAGDLTGVRQVRAGVQAMAEKHPGWVPMMHVADAHYLRACGELERALRAVERATSAVAECEVLSGWVVAGRTLAVEVLTELGRADEALSMGFAELERVEALGMRVQARNLSRAIALAEAKVGRCETALKRVEAVLAEQTALGVTGLQLGQSYEVAARVGLGANDGELFRRYAALAREQYHPGKSSVLGALYERLMDEGRQARFVEFEPIAIGRDGGAGEGRSSDDLETLMAGCANARERAERALGLLCDGDPPTRGHLLLCTPEGLRLVASNTACESVTQIVSFASSCLERESQASTMETGALSSVSLGTLAAEWRDDAGVDYEVVLLGTTISGTFSIGGIALLAKLGAPLARNSARLAEAIARTLITSGDATSVVAA
jgi:hypothetical protein